MNKGNPQYLKKKLLNFSYIKVSCYTIIMKKIDLEEFFRRLEKLLEINGCNAHDLTNAQIVLEEMNIPEKEQEEFLEDCRNSGGFCDCEIFLNAEEDLREKYGT